MVELQGAQLSGNITLDGGSIFMKEPHWLRTQVGMVLPTPVIFPGTVYDNICAGLRLHGLRSRNKLMERVEKVLKELGIYREYYPMLEIRCLFSAHAPAAAGLHLPCSGNGTGTAADG